ncbi:hypothetical protein PF002_g33362 [Phytophthora fragariae]|uniref:Uncharacterized protein n=2 Tax=Phytophthora TaxID=4783 RepID=A0A6A3P9H7_9STRA|nr:hypothetical protein PR001_g33328 [Phytophthora rubi]KAE9053885.1 hypothetical protein PF007_g32820 [Phytophthora fragariae]KAE9157513.1 hypothetical protein PF002_g33362 [Phytophthora fragariae]KAE9260257.1 hypothetical protein PR003_g34448 [Phytophthora rubi]
MLDGCGISTGHGAGVGTRMCLEEGFRSLDYTVECIDHHETMCVAL